MPLLDCESAIGGIATCFALLLLQIDFLSYYSINVVSSSMVHSDLVYSGLRIRMKPAWAAQVTKVHEVMADMECDGSRMKT